MGSSHSGFRDVRTSVVKKSIPTKTSRCERIKSSSRRYDCFRFGAGEMPWRRRTLPTVIRIDHALDLPRHLRSDRSPSSDFPSPFARPRVLFPDLVLGALHFPEFRPIKFLRDELPIPTEIVFGLGRCSYVLQHLSRQAVTDLGQCCFLPKAAADP